MDKFQKIIMALAIAGFALVSAAILFPGLDLFLFFSVYLGLAFLLVPTYLFKIFGRADTFYIISLLKTKRLIGFIEKISKPRIWDFLADLGLVIGFGAIGVDYLFGRKFSKPKRLLIAGISSALLFVVFFGFFLTFLVSPNSDFLPTVILFSLGFAFGGLMLFALVALAWQVFDIFSKIMVGKTPCPGVVPIIPGLHLIFQIPNVPSFLMPPISVWGAFLIILVVHEFSHGALMKRSRIKIKSVGIALLGLLPIGAFVEPLNEAQLKSLPDRKQLRIYAIGPASNIYSMLVFIALIVFVSITLGPVIGSTVNSMEREIEFESVVIVGVMEDYDLCGNTIKIPANGVIEKGWILQKYNGIELNTLYDFRQALLKPDRNVSMVFETKEGIVEKTLEKNQRDEIGIITALNYMPGKEPTQGYKTIVFLLSDILTFVGWLFILSFAVAMINFVPMDPFDGGKIAKIILLPYFGFLGMNKKETEKFIGRLFLWIVAGLLLLNALPLLL